MKRSIRAGFTAFDLIVVFAVVGFLIGLLLPAVQKVREASNRMKSTNNMKMLALACHNYHDQHGSLPPGMDEKGFSTVAYLLPYLEQDNVFKRIDFKKPAMDDANGAVRKEHLKVLIDPSDAVPPLAVDSGPTNYLFCAGSQPSLDDNNGVCYRNSNIKLFDIVDGTSNTILVGATLRGDRGQRAVDVRRQHVVLDEKALKDLKDDSGVADFQNNRNIAGDRCARWIDGSFLQGTFTGTRIGNDAKPDVNCAGKGGLSALRRDGAMVLVGTADGAVRAVAANMALQTWQGFAGRNDGMVLRID